MAFRRDVAYLDPCVPEYVDLNGQEFLRVVRLLEAVLPRLIEAPARVQWVSDASGLYASRLHETELLAHDLREAYAVAGAALVAYAPALAAARAKLAAGDEFADLLAELLRPLIWYQSVQFRASEPLAQWEDLREITGGIAGWKDRLAEQLLQDDIDRIRGLADHYYYSAAHLYDDARSIDRDARQECLARLQEANRRLPDFAGNSSAANLIVKYLPGMAAEMEEAAAVDTGLRLPGQGVIPAYGSGIGGATDLHLDIQQRASNIHVDGPSWDTWDSANWIFLGNKDDEAQLKLEWIHAYSSVIQAAAYENGIPPDVLAGVVYMEVGGKPMWLDDAADNLRQLGIYPGNPNDTSYGPLAVQVDTAAVALGYDPANLSDAARASIITSLKDPVQNIMITAKVLADAKDGTDFALVDPGDMTVEQGMRLAAAYNGGPDWDGGAAQGYAATYAEHRTEAAGALQ